MFFQKEIENQPNQTANNNNSGEEAVGQTDQPPAAKISISADDTSDEDSTLNPIESKDLISPETDSDAVADMNAADDEVSALVDEDGELNDDGNQDQVSGDDDQDFNITPEQAELNK